MIENILYFIPFLIIDFSANSMMESKAGESMSMGMVSEIVKEAVIKIAEVVVGMCSIITVIHFNANYNNNFCLCYFIAKMLTTMFRWLGW